MDGCHNVSQSASVCCYLDLFPRGGLAGLDVGMCSSFMTLGGWIISGGVITSCASMILMALSSFICSLLLTDSSPSFPLI